MNPDFTETQYTSKTLTKNITPFEFMIDYII